jgi:hypothetical protein
LFRGVVVSESGPLGCGPVVLCIELTGESVSRAIEAVFGLNEFVGCSQ